VTVGKFPVAYFRCVDKQVQNKVEKYQSTKKVDYNVKLILILTGRRSVLGKDSLLP
jgi:hypothetical protein